MANHKSSVKRSTQSLVRNARNRSYMSRVRTEVKKLRTGFVEFSEGKTDKAAIDTLLCSAQSWLQKAAQKGRIHDNTASRQISRLFQAWTKVQAAKA